MNDAFEVIAAIFLIREREAQNRKDYSAAIAYDNAFDLLRYAIDDRHDYLEQFDEYAEANDLIDHSVYGDLWDLEQIFKNPS